MSKQFLEQPDTIGGGRKWKIPGQAKISHFCVFFCSKFTILQLKQIQCLAKVFGPLQLFDLLPHFRPQT